MGDAGSKTSLNRMDSNSLVQMTRSGDRAALCELIERYRSLGRRTALSILENRKYSEDALQEASLRAFLTRNFSFRKPGYS
jgi:DNA-directed RNA polymerase specialized sigma24 family protein